MKLWILSDLHIEQSLWDLPEVRPDCDVLVAAGDIHFRGSTPFGWLADRVSPAIMNGILTSAVS